MSLSSRGSKGLKIPQCSHGLNDLYVSDPYNVDTNPNGYIKLSSADNVLTVDKLSEKFCVNALDGFDAATLLPFYPRPSGSPETLLSVAAFLNTFCAPGLIKPISPENLILVSGVTAASDLISNAIRDEDDIILTTAPFYYRFTNDYGDRSLVKLKVINAFVNVDKPFEISVNLFEAKFQELLQKGLKVKAILLVNPRNPDGGVTNLADLKLIVEWAIKKHGIYVIFDEIYNLLVYDSKVKFESALYLFDKDSSLDSSLFIWIWGLSKVFSVPGLRFGTIYTPNEAVRDSVTRSLMYQVPNVITQHLVRRLLDDRAWVAEFLAINNANLKSARNYFVTSLNSLSTLTKQIRIADSAAGFFFLADFSDFLSEPTRNAEVALFKSLFNEKVLVITGADVKMPKPGWLRIVFSANSKSEVDQVVLRIGKALNNI